MAQPPARIAAPPAPLPDVAQTRSVLGRIRPDLLERFDAAVATATAAVLARLLGALHREPLPSLVDRAPDAGDGHFRATFEHGVTVIFPTSAAEPLIPTGAPGVVARVGGVAVTAPGELARVLWPGAALGGELDNSVANLALGIAAQAGLGSWTLRDAEGDPDGLGRLEQLVVDGHPLHPCCRTREGMTTEDVLAYAPEHRNVVRLRRLAVPAELWRGDGDPILLAHPWQAARLLAEFAWLRDVGATGPMRPLMSLRTFAPLDGGPHVKTAVDVRMTSAVRTVSPAAVHNGPRLSALLTELTSDLGTLHILAETAAGHVVVDGVPQRRMAHLIREAPRPHEDEAIVPLGALAAAGSEAAGGGTAGGSLIEQAVARAGGDPYRWLEDLVLVWLPPLLRVLDRGVALEAHGQNTLVGLRAGRPVRVFYRDFGGVRVRSRDGGHGLIGDLPSDDPAELRRKLAAGALGTVAYEVVTLLHRRLGADPRRLWSIVAAAIRSSGTADAELLLAEPLPVKATTAMRLAAEPLDDVWCHLNNPMTRGAR